MQQLIERMFDSPPSLPLKPLKTDIYDYIKYAPPIHRYIGWRSILILTDFNHHISVLAFNVDVCGD